MESDRQQRAPALESRETVAAKSSTIGNKERQLEMGRSVQYISLLICSFLAYRCRYIEATLASHFTVASNASALQLRWIMALATGRRRKLTGFSPQLNPRLL